MYLVFDRIIADSNYQLCFCRNHSVILKYILQNYKGVIKTTLIHINTNLEDIHMPNHTIGYHTLKVNSDSVSFPKM